MTENVKNKAPISIDASLDLLVGLTARFSNNPAQREMASEFLNKILDGYKQDLNQDTNSIFFVNQLLCLLSSSLRSIASIRGTFLLGSNYLHQQRDLKIGYLNSLVGLTSLNKEAIIWRLLGMTAGGGSAILFKGINNLNSPVAISIVLIGSIIGYVLIDIILKWYVFRSKRKIMQLTEKKIRSHWDNTALVNYRNILKIFINRYFQIYKESYGGSFFQDKDKNKDVVISELVENRLKLFPSGSLGSDIFDEE